HQGVNAFERAVAIVNKLQALQRELDESILLVGGRVEAGTNFNSVPDRCRFTIDRRTNPAEDFEAEKRRVIEILDSARADGIDLEVRTIQEGRAAWSADDSALGRALAASIAETTGKPAAFELCPGLLEIRFYADRGVPAFAYGPGALAVSPWPQALLTLRRMIEWAR